VCGGAGFGGTRFLVLRSLTRFRPYLRCRFLFSCFAVPGSFLTVPRASVLVFSFCGPGLIFSGTEGDGPIFMFYVAGLIFGGSQGVGSRFHVLRSRTRFRRYRGRRSRFHVLRSRTRFRPFRGRQVPFSCFAVPDSFSAILRAWGQVFMFCVPGLVFGGTTGVGSRFYVLRSRTRFRRFQGRQVSFSCFALPDRFRRYRWRRFPFSHFLLPDSFSAVSGVSGLVFMFYAPGLVFGGTEGVRSNFLLLRSRTHFRQYLERRVPFSCFTLPDSFSAVPGASGPIFMFCAPGFVFGGCEGVGSRFHDLRAQTLFRRYRGRRVPFSSFALPESFSAVPRASDLIFMFCALGLVFGGTVPFSCLLLPGSFSAVLRASVLVLRSQTSFRPYLRCRFPFSCFALPDSFSTVPRASDPVFMFCAP
jgi:hypothetical protein